MHISWRAGRNFAAAAVVIAATACSSTHSTYVPDGRRGFAITCGGVLNSASSCLVKAGRACGGQGYDTIKGNEEDRGMLIACKVPGAAGVRNAAPGDGR
jgi:hypothetical protein